MKRQYDRPTQVSWFDYNEDKWIGGIAYQDEIICGCCGSILELSEFEDGEIVELGDWVDIEEAIRGGWDV